MVSAPTWITVCTTCKRPEWAEGAAETDGARLAALVEAAAREALGVRVRRHACLMGCSNACNVAVQAKAKLSYTLGGFAPAPAAAEAIVGYAVLHAETETGQVRYRAWPEGVKGHFVTRHPPLPE